MKLQAIFAAALSLLSAAEACKCVKKGTHISDDTATQGCCMLRGDFVDGDCVASSMHGKFATFSGCCDHYGFKSDCRCKGLFPC